MLDPEKYFIAKEKPASLCFLYSL